MGYLMFGVVVLLSALLLRIRYVNEVKRWNNGLCPRCNEKWQLFNETYDERRYKCPNCKINLWITMLSKQIRKVK